MASSLTDFSHRPTNDRQESGVLPVISASVFRPFPNKSVRTSRGASAPERSSEPFFSVSVFCNLYSGDVSETAGETFLRRSLERFTRGVEMSLTNCHLSQLCGRAPLSSSSTSPAARSSLSSRWAFFGFIRSLNAIASIGGRTPLFAEARHHNNQRLEQR